MVFYTFHKLYTILELNSIFVYFNMIKRIAEEELVILAEEFKSVAVIGPRQSGKTTLVRKVFTDKPYISLENYDTRAFAMEDPRGFLATYPNGAILDEIQNVPTLFSYLQQVLDEATENGMFILTGSNNFLLQESISQSLAGRIGYLKLLPLSLKEIDQRDMDVNNLLFKGGYPILYSESANINRWLSNYIQTYVERDVRQLKNIMNLPSFERFIRLCAARAGQLLNMSNLAMETGVDVKTVDSWLGVLEQSFIAFRFRPYFKNYNKRIVKIPKLYFYDTGLIWALLGIENQNDVIYHPYRGNIFENMIVLELLKARWNRAKESNLYFWRDNFGNEIDVIIDRGTEQIPVEIKSGQTINSDFFKGLKYWNKITGTEGGNVVYGGNEIQKRSEGFNVYPFNKLDEIRA